MQKAFRNILMIALLAIVLFGVFQFINGNGQSPKQLTYNEFMTKLEKGDLKTLTIQPEQNVYMVSGELKKVKMKHIHLLFYLIIKMT